MKHVLVVLIMLGVFASGATGCAVLIPAAVGVGVLGSEEDCRVEETTFFSSVGCAGASMQKAVIAPFATGDTPRSEVNKAVPVEEPSTKKSTTKRK